MQKLFWIKDSVAMRFTDVLTATTQGMAIRQTVPFIKNRPEFKDLELYEVGECDENTGKITAYDTPIQVDWNNYTFNKPNGENETKKESIEEYVRKAMEIKD